MKENRKKKKEEEEDVNNNNTNDDEKKSETDRLLTMSFQNQETREVKLWNVYQTMFRNNSVGFVWVCDRVNTFFIESNFPT